MTLMLKSALNLISTITPSLPARAQYSSLPISQHFPQQPSSNPPGSLWPQPRSYTTIPPALQTSQAPHFSDRATDKHSQSSPELQEFPSVRHLDQRRIMSRL